ncbi:glycerate kinase [Klebsiella pneumoniae]|nr:glycerate kinase [Klebsiella pneumoniae]
MGAALYAFCGAFQLRPGIEIVTDALQLAERVADADLVITGEGAYRIARRSTAKCRWGWRGWCWALTSR